MPWTFLCSRLRDYWVMGTTVSWELLGQACITVQIQSSVAENWCEQGFYA